MKLCKLDELTPCSSRGFRLTDGTEIFIIRQNINVYAYKNSCPHTGVNLEWMPDRFLDPVNNEFIQCAMHGALFTIEDGLCIKGPCQGDSLTPVDVKIISGEIELL